MDDCCSEKGTLAENSAGEETYSSSDEEGNPETDGRKTKGAKRPKNETTEEKKVRSLKWYTRYRQEQSRMDG